MSKIKTYVIMILITLLALTNLDKWFPALVLDRVPESVKSRYESSLTLEDIRRVAQLSSIEYLMEAKIVIYKPKDRIWIIDIPQTDKFYLAVAQGKVKAGIDLGKLQGFRIEGDTAILRLPPAEILDYYIDPKTKWEKEEEKLFSKIKPEELTRAQVKAEKEMVLRAIQNDILIRADENAKVIMEDFLLTAGIKKIVFEPN